MYIHRKEPKWNHWSNRNFMLLLNFLPFFLSLNVTSESTFPLLPLFFISIRFQDQVLPYFMPGWFSGTYLADFLVFFLLCCSCFALFPELIEVGPSICLAAVSGRSFYSFHIGSRSLFIEVLLYLVSFLNKILGKFLI